MKELSIEQKAKRYDEALERAKMEMSKDGMKNDVIARHLAETIFPELKESEDEKVRKELLVFCRTLATGRTSVLANNIDFNKWIDWLENQSEKKSLDDVAKEVTKNKETAISFLKFCGIMNANGELADEYKIEQDEQKSADKVEPKFHEGDWVVYNNDICQIVKREEGCNKLVTVFGIEKELVNERNLSTARLWTIQDAKDGDVLVEKSRGVILMFRGIGNREWNDVIDYHCYYSCYQKEFIIQEDIEYFGTIKDNKLKPATKEQCDLLFQKITEAWYTFDFEKKELIKIRKDDDKLREAICE